MSVVRDLKIRLSMNVAIIEQLERGSENPGKDGGQSRIVASMPEIIIDKDEWDRRMSDAALVLHEGWELDNDGPPAVRTGGVTALTKNSVTLHAYADTHGATTCGFMIDTLKDCTNASHDADQSPLDVNLDDKAFSHGVAGLTPGTKYYYRPWVNTAGLYTRYGTVRSFTTPLV
jgi:hypothetical protein